MDAFDLLALPRRPWLDPDGVRAAFQARARSLHPDHAAGNTGDFARLNAAYRELESPASRLRLLIWGSEIPSSPPDFALGFEVGAFLRECDAVLVRRRQATGALSRALLAGEWENARSRLAALSLEVEQRTGSAIARLRELDAAWPDVAKNDLAELAGAFTYLDRWAAQLRERRVELSVLDS